MKPLRLFPALLIGATALLASTAGAQQPWRNAERFDKMMEGPVEAFRVDGGEAASKALDTLEQYWRQPENADPVALARIEYERGRIDLLADRDDRAVERFTAVIAMLDPYRAIAGSFLVDAYRDRASAHWGALRLLQAESDAREAVRLSDSLDAVAANTRATARFTLAQILDSRFRSVESGARLQEALEIAATNADIDPNDYGEMVSYFVNRQSLEEGQARAMLSVVTRAIAKMERSLDEPTLSLGDLHASLAAILEKRGRTQEALGEIDAAIAIAKAVQQGSGRDDAMSYIKEAFWRHNKANTLRLLHQYEPAQQEIDVMTAIIAKYLPERHPVRVFMGRVRALNLIDLGQRNKGLAQLQADYDQFASLVAPTELRRIAWQKDLAEAALKDGRLQDAARYYTEAAEGLDARARERRSDAVVSQREWDEHRAVYLGIIRTAATEAGL